MVAALHEQDVRAMSEEIWDNINSSHTEHHKEAAASLSEFTRERVRESSYRDSIITPQDLTDEEIVSQLHTDDPVVHISFEPDSPGAMQVDVADAPDDVYIFGKKYPVTIQQYNTARVNKQLYQLRSYKYDLRQVISDNMTKDLIARRDYVLMNAVSKILVGPDQTNAYAGRPLYITMGDAITYESFQDATKVLSDEPFNLQPQKVLMSHHTVKELKKLIANEFRGTTFADDVIRRGFTMESFDGYDLIVTIKTRIVPHGDMFFFPDEKFMGACRVMAQPTMVVKREDQDISFYIYMQEGMSLGHLACASRVQFLY